MNEILFQYHRPNPTTWVYISTLLSIGLFFKFNRFWSIRNLDLVLVFLLAPGLVMANYGLEMRAAAEAKLQAEEQAEAPTPPPADAGDFGPPPGQTSLPTTPDDSTADPSRGDPLPANGGRLPDETRYVEDGAGAADAEATPDAAGPARSPAGRARAGAWRAG
jgi:hypothetical protein